MEDAHFTFGFEGSHSLRIDVASIHMYILKLSFVPSLTVLNGTRVDPDMQYSTGNSFDGYLKACVEMTYK